MEDLKQVFEEKNFDEKTLELIENFLNEFQEVFGKYLSREKVIERIKNNLNHSIEFTDGLGKNTTGTYNSQEKRIRLISGLNEEVLKSVFFHEMIHCITAEKDFVGFGVKYLDEDDMFSNNVQTARGITEGFTQLATKKRNQRYGINYNTYPILTEQVENLAELMGEENFFDVAFNNPLGLEDAMLEAGIVEYHGETDLFLKNFNVILQYEKDILEKREYAKTAEERLLIAILGQQPEKNPNVELAKSSIATTFLGVYDKREITTVDEFVEIFGKTEKYSRQLNMEGITSVYYTCFEKFKSLAETESQREELLGKLPDKIRKIVETQLKFDKFIEQSPAEILKMMADDSEWIYDELLVNRFADDYIKLMTLRIFQGIGSEKYAIDLGKQLIGDFAKEILDKEYNIDKLAFEFIRIPGFSNVAFNLYESDGNEVSYLGTYSNITSDCELTEYKPCSEEERKRIVEELELEGSESILTNQTGGVIIYFGDCIYRLIEDEGYIYENDGEVKNTQSNIEYLKAQLRRQTERAKIGIKGNFPKEIIRNNLELVQKTKNSIEAKLGKKKFTPQDIEDATIEEVGIEELDAILEEFKVVKIDREEIFEKGIGYNE